MIFIGYLFMGGLFAAYGFDAYKYKGPKYQAPESTRAVRFFREKCLQFKIEDVCATGFNHLVRIDMVDKVWFQPNFNKSITTIGLTEFSVFTPLMKISIDRRLTVDNVLLDTTIIHELGHAILDLDHDDSKIAIMNAQMNDLNTIESNYDRLVNEMFEDFIKNNM